MQWTPRLIKWALNLYGPYLGAGVKVTHIDPEWRELHVQMKLRWYNRNVVGTHFGGSLYSMTDPHMMLLLMQRLGKDYIVWDKAADIDYIKAAKGTVRAEFHLSDQRLQDIIENTADGTSYKPSFEIEVKDDEGKVVSKVNKTLYIKRKPEDPTNQP